MGTFFPFVHWLRSYKRHYFLKDLFAGITIGIVLIPQGMAYAMIAGLPPVYGLYAALLPILVYALLGTSRQLAVGPVAMDSLLVAAGLGTLAITGIENYIAIAILLTFMVGVLQLVLGLLRMGFLVNFLSKPVISGFTSAAALIILFSQLKHLLGTTAAQSNQFHRLFLNNMNSLGETNGITVLMGLLGILIILGLTKWNAKIPAILIVVILGILAVSVFSLDSLGIAIVGSVPEGLPAFRVPQFNWMHIKTLFPMALALAIIGYTEAISIGQSLEEKNDRDTLDANQELVALGASNLLGSFFQSYAVTASFSRSAISYKTGAKTQLFALVSVVLVVLTLLFLTPLFYYLPNTILASIIMVSVVGLIDLEYPRQLWKRQRDEFYLLVFTFLATLFLGIQQGILFGVLLSLILMLYRTSNPHFAVLGKIKGSEYYKNVSRFGDQIEIRDDLLIVRFDSQLFFGNKNFFKKQLLNYINAKGSTLKAVILSAEAINYIDSTATNMLTQLIQEIHQRNIKFYITGAIGPTRDVIFNSGIINYLPKEHLFVRIEEAVAYFENPKSATELQSRVAYQNKPWGN